MAFWATPSAAQVPEAWSGEWAIGPADEVELPLRLVVAGESAELVGLGSLGRWPAAPAEILAAADASASVTAEAAGAGVIRLRSADWTALVGLGGEGTAVWLDPEVSAPGLAYRLAAVPSELHGEWQRAEPSPVGARTRRLVLGEDEVVLYDRLDRPTEVPALSPAAVGDVARVVLFPTDADPTGVRLLPAGLALVAVGAATEPIQIAYRPDAAPPWIDPEWSPGDAALTAASPGARGSWLVQPSSRRRLPILLDLDAEPPRERHLGSGDDVALAVVLAEDNFSRLRRADGEVVEVALGAGGWGVLWPAEGGRPAQLWRVGAVDPALLGDWVVEAVGSWVAEPVTVTADRLERPLWGTGVDLAGLGGGGATRLALLEADRAGRLVELYRLGDGDVWVSQRGDLWYRPGAREVLAELLGESSCSEVAGRLREVLAPCVAERCRGTSCGVAEALVTPLRCSDEQREQGERLLAGDCDDWWPHALESGP